MTAEFSAFAAAMEAGGRRQAASGLGAAPVYDRVTVLGGGADARLLAAICLGEGAAVTLFSAYGAELEAIRAGGVVLRGAGPVGAYQADREDAPSIRTTAELDRAVAGAELIFLTGPIHKQRTYAMVLADHLRDGQVVVLPAARSLGAVEAAWLLRVGGAAADVTLIDMQGAPFWAEGDGGAALTLYDAAPPLCATLPSGRGPAIEGLRRFFPGLVAAPSVLHSGFADGTGVVEAPALLIGGPAAGDGGPEIPVAGAPLPENHCFRALIGPEHARLIAALGAERRAVASRFGVRDLPDDEAWIETVAGTLGGPARRPVPGREAARAILRDVAIGSLEPLASAGRAAGAPTPATAAMIQMISTALGADLAPAGRRLETMGVAAHDVDDARRRLDAIAGDPLAGGL